MSSITGYEVVQILRVSGSQRGTTVGFSAFKEGTDRITQPAIYDGYEEAEKRVNELNSELAIKANWPDANDPEVKKLLTDPTFHPIVDVAPVETNEHGVPTEDVTFTKESSPFWRISQACELVARKRAGLL
jgi:hypothetical protein